MIDEKANINGVRPSSGDPFVPCRFCIRMVGEVCRQKGCVHDAYVQGAVSPATDWLRDPKEDK